ncbi:hypothetical protein EYZ11_011776 [Aspergillus tanneri]|uniref:Uncharacterized protein n=1 Tax=Aspergillus tanneri TaxID=1220188 RepID=A0A4S3J424_9EURO|nr:hypothetical protein EYZ11_011776 [Aspergillus tanneri]
MCREPTATTRLGVELDPSQTFFRDIDLFIGTCKLDVKTGGRILEKRGNGFGASFAGGQATVDQSFGK